LTINDADNLEEQLRPAEMGILAFAKAHPDLPFCWREFAPKYAHGTIRNAFSKLANLNLIELWCRSSDAYYILHIAGRKRPRKAVTVTHMGGKYNLKQLTIEDYVKYLDSLGWEEIWKVHDLVLCFEIEGLYEQVLREGKFHVNEQSKDIQFLIIGWENNRSLNVILHRTGTVTCYLKCSECPIEVTPEGLVDLSAFLGRVQTRLADALDASSTESGVTSVPDVSSWVVTQWHYGKDGKSEISGKSLNVTYKTWSGALVRIYLKKHGKKFKARKEIIEQPRNTLPRTFSDKIVSEKSYETEEFKGDS
jgi:hypothetical protein